MTDGTGIDETARAALPQATYLREAAPCDFEVSVVTLVADQGRYERMLASAAAKGFDAERAQFIALDNRGANRFDGFTALRSALPLCRGRFVMFTHDDVEFTHDGLDELLARLDELSAAHPDWALAGNAGCLSTRTTEPRTYRHIIDPHGEHRVAAPMLVNALDENLFVMARDRAVLGALDLSGFHCYAADLCLTAEVMGGKAYVIPFLLTHHSAGNPSADFKAACDQMIAKYRRFFIGRRHRTPAAKMPFGWGGLKTAVREALRLGSPAGV